MPAQLITAYGTSNASFVALASASTEAGLVTSVSMKRAAGEPSLAMHASATAEPRVWLRPATTVLQPSSAKRIAIARPIPEVPPMTTTMRASAMIAILPCDVEELRHRLDLEVHHRVPWLDAAAPLRRRAQERSLRRLHDDVDDRRRRREPARVKWQGIARVHADRGRVDREVHARGIGVGHFEVAVR